MNCEAIQAKLFEAFCECSFYDEIISKYDNEIGAETSLFDDLQIESIQLLEFIIMTEKKLEKNIDFEELDIQNFASIGKLSRSLAALFQ